MMWTSRTSLRNCAHAVTPIAATAAMTAILAGHRNIGVPFSFNPDFAISEVFLFPDGYQFLDAVDAFERGFERRPAMRRGDDDGNAGFADEDAAEAMNHGDAFDGVRLGDFP